jgi:hypothetical protein
MAVCRFGTFRRETNVVAEVPAAAFIKAKKGVVVVAQEQVLIRSY